MIYELSFRDESRNRGGPVLPGRLTWIAPDGDRSGPPARDALLRESRLVFVVHGYNVSLRRGRGSLRRLAGMLPSQRHAGLVTTLWPGDHWSRAASYPFEGRDADDTADALARFIGDHVPRTTPLSFASHSLGARVVLGTLDRLAGRFPVEQVCVTAAAVDDSSPADPRVHRPGVSTAERVAVLSSRRDKVLLAAYPLGDLIQAFLFWREQADLALGLHGPRPAGASPVPANVAHEAIPTERGADHGDYLPPADPGEPVNAEQRSTADYVDRVLAGAPDPHYA